MAVQTDAATLAYQLDELSQQWRFRKTLSPASPRFHTNRAQQYSYYFRLNSLRRTDRSRRQYSLVPKTKHFGWWLSHLYAMYGRSFRVQIRQLLPDLLKIVFADDKQHYTLCLVMMATMTQSLLTALSQLTNID